MSTIDKIETLLVEAFKAVPFHNIFMLHKIDNTDLSLGGTCSDKVLYFREVLRDNGIDTKLHSSFINGIECHRLLSVIIDDKKYFIEIGSGWPTIKLFPTFKPTEYEVCGMYFKTKIADKRLIICHKTSETYKDMIEVPFSTKSELEILYDIKNRHKDTSIYPFQKSLRFSILKGDSFYFIKGSTLRIYRKTKMTEKKLTLDEINMLLKNEFGFTYLKNVPLRAHFLN